MFDSLEEVAARFDELNSQLADPGVASDPHAYHRVHKEIVQLQELVDAFRAWKAARSERDEAKELLRDDDSEMRELARADVDRLEAEIEDVESRLRVLMLPKDPLDDKNVVLEIRAGTGGDESALFCGDLFEMYGRYAASRGWKIELLSQSEGSVGGFKEVVALIQGDRVYSHLKWESGVHRVQRVPATETQGRIHTSACTVAILPEAEDVEVNVDPNDLRVDTFRASGAGGQHVNRTDSAVRITHLPSGLVVSCQDEKSQHKNRDKAMKVLKSRLLDAETQRQHSERADARRAQVGSGDRSERIRTYNFPQNRLTDHRIGLTLYKLDAVMQGALDDVVDALNTEHQARLLQQAEQPNA